MKQASKKEDTKQRILDEALRLFSQSGYDAVSVERIASAVGIKAPSLYKHFKSKQEIFDAIVAETYRRYDTFTDAGLIGGFAGERVLRAPADGAFRSVRRIGDLVKAGDVAGYVSGEPMVCTIDGVLRGLIADGIPVRKGMKSGDVDPRGNVENCYTVSDKATAVGGGVLEAILHLSGVLLED